MSDRDLAGRHFVVTGANTGIGRVTATELAKRGAHVLLACRSEEKTKPVIEEIVNAGGVADFLQLDLADFSSIRKAAKAILDRDEPLDVLVNNAGLAGLRGLTKDGFELTIGTNHLGHFLLTTLLLPKLREAKKPRIVNVASKAHYDAKQLDFSQFRVSTKTMTGVPEYSVSKLCNILFTKSLAAGKAGGDIKSYSLHPGVVASDAWRQMPWPIRPIMKLFMISNEEGAKTSLYCATSPAVEDLSGEYFDECAVRKPSKLALDMDLADELWKKSEEWVAS
jgi:NAD(P)-dependent dehydrogenase (short-subunit alcohol dehydrogenase family)